MILTLLAVFLLALGQAEQRFTPVEGATLQAKQEAASRAASSAGQSRYWTAYSFDVRPGVAVDVDYVSDDGRIAVQGTWSPDSSVFRLDPSVETRSLGVFLLRDPQAGGTPVRVEVYNLARRHDYSGYPVYWLGRASNEESLGLLRQLAEAGAARSHDLAADAVGAIALHDDRRVPEVLAALARSQLPSDVRARALRALGQQPQPPAPQTREVLAALARDERESQDVRRAAVSAYARARDPQALTFLQGFYDSVQSHDLKRSALAGIGRNENRAGAAAFVIRVAASDADGELRKQARHLLGEMAGEQALGGVAPRTDADTELQKQAVVAVSKRPAAESVPLLIGVARTHQKPEVRRQALVLLGRTEDPAAFEYLKSVVAK